MKSVLVVEDDAQLNQLLYNVVCSLEYVCYQANTVSEGYRLLEQHKPDLIILDRVLPDGDGLELARYSSDFFFTTRILCLSTLGTSQNRILGLESGVDDYLPKPFALKELSLRINKLLCSEKTHPDPSFTIGPVRYFPKNGMVLFGHTAIQLRKKEAAVVTCLCRHKNQVLSREQIIQYVWQGVADPPTTSTLDVYIRRIRAKLGKHANIISTTRGFGYSITG